MIWENDHFHTEVQWRWDHLCNATQIKYSMCSPAFIEDKTQGAWNVLPKLVVEADTMVLFQILLARQVYMQGMEGSGSDTGRGV